MTKGLAVIGFIGLLLALAWLIFFGVGYLPTLINNMASVIQTETNYELSTYPLEDSVSHNSTVGIEWSSVDAAGEFEFSYACTEGVSVEIRTPEQGIQSLACDTPYTAGDVTGVDVTLRSVADRFADVPYTVTFLPNNNPEGSVSTTNRIAVFNPNVSILGTDEEDESPATSTPPVTEEETDVADSDEEETVTEQPNPTPTTPAPVTPPTYVTQYEIPVSDPNGTTNLRVSYLGVGELDSNHKFTPRASLDNHTTGAIRFAVTNTGTRTSDTWTYEATLPNGQEYTSSRERGLKPNETATLTLGFRTGGTDGNYPFNIEIETTRDTNHNDNDLFWSVEIR